ncbi:MAG: cell envelope biogenesis protein TolA [Pseudomonadota bacterium]
MSVGTYISGVGHTALVVWMVAGWGMQVEPLPFEVTEVSVISGEEFAALTQGVQPDQPVGAVPELTPPVVEPEQPAPPAPVADETPPAEVTPPTPIEPPTLEVPPEAPDLSTPETVVTDVAPEAPSTPTLVAPPTNIELGSSPRPVPRPVPRVAPEIVAPPPPDATVDPQVAEAAVESPDAPLEEEVDPADETTAPEEAVDQIVTEAEEPEAGEQISLAPTSSARPVVRPDRPAVVEDATDDAVEAALADALAAETTSEPALDPTPTVGANGGDLSAGDRASLLRQIGGCWSVGSLSTAALNTRVTVQWAMDAGGILDVNSIEMTGFEGGSSADAAVAYRQARSALVRCQNANGRQGYDLPQEQFQTRRILQLTFDPSEMALR